MPEGKPAYVPDDGLTTRQRRNRPLVIVHTGEGKGKSTAAFGLALRGWNQGWSIGVFQFVKSAKWRIGEQDALRALGDIHNETGRGGPIAWHKMGEGWSWLRRNTPNSHNATETSTDSRGSTDDRNSTESDQAEQAREGWAQIKRDLTNETHQLYVLDEFTYPMKWGWIDVDDVISTLTSRPGTQHIIITGRNADPKLIAMADLVTEMTKLKHPMDTGQKGQKGIEW